MGCCMKKNVTHSLQSVTRFLMNGMHHLMCVMKNLTRSVSFHHHETVRTVRPEPMQVLQRKQQAMRFV